MPGDEGCVPPQQISVGADISPPKMPWGNAPKAPGLWHLPSELPDISLAQQKHCGRGHLGHQRGLEDSVPAQRLGWSPATSAPHISHALDAVSKELLLK